MKLTLTGFVSLVYFANFALAKGGGGGGGHGGGESSGGHGGEDGSSSGGHGGISEDSVSHAKGGFGSFTNGIPPTTYATTRNTFKSPIIVSNLPYNSTTQCGMVGVYNSTIHDFYIVPPYQYQGYSKEYSRYDQNTGYYYAAKLAAGEISGSHVMINGTANDGGTNNFRYVFDIITDNQFLTVDHAYFSTSDPSARNADFVYRTQFSQLVEFNDANRNGMYDNGEKIYSVTSLQGLPWETMQVYNMTAPTNATQLYLRTGTAASVNYNNTNPISQKSMPFNISITWRTSNLQLNNIASIPMQPNSLQYDFSVTGFPTNISGTNPNATLALTSVFSSLMGTPFVADVNATTLANVTASDKRNTTYGVSLGQYIQGRLEFQNNVNISSFNGSVSDGWGTLINPQELAFIPSRNMSEWIWGVNSTSVNQTQTMMFVTFPGYSGVVNGTINSTISGLEFLDIDVMNNIASWGVKSVEAGTLTLMLVTLMTICAMFA